VSKEDYTRFRHLTFEGFQKLAADQTLTQYEKIGFPNSYREGKEEAIFADILSKLTSLSSQGKTVVDIGPGCSGLPGSLLAQCRAHQHHVFLIDSAEMLALIPDDACAAKLAARFPEGCMDFISGNRGKIDTILTYSVFHYIYAEGSVFEFLDRCLELLAPGGELLIGDIPNISKRKRFFSAPAGVKFHQNFTNSNEVPSVQFNRIEAGEIDDSVIFSVLLRARAAGFDAYLVPQAPELPMANRREDILIRRP
jgi:SAM-dependent methyltransferase